MNENELNDCHLNKNEVFESAFDSSVNETEEENNQVNDRFKKVEGYHAVPPPYTRNYMPSRPDLSFAGLDDSVYKTNVSETITSVPRNESNASKSSKDSLEQPKDVRPSAHTNLISSDTEKLQELTETHTQTTSSSRSQHTKLSRANRLLSLFKAKPARFKQYKNFFQELHGRYTYLFEHLKERFLSRKSFDTLADHLQEVMVESLPTMVDTHIKEQVKKQVPEQMIAKAILQERGNIQAEISSQIQKTIDNHIPSQVDASDDPHDDAHPEGENRAKRQKTSEYEAYVSGESSSGQVNENEQGPSTSGNQEQEDDYDFWTESYASDDDEIPMKQICTSGDEHQYHIDQMKNFLKSDIVWESRKEILVSSHPRKTTPLVQSCQRDPEAPPLSLINQDLLFQKKGSTGPKKIVLSLHKFPAIIFNDDDIEERTSRWVNKCVKKFNPYARYGVEHWKNPHAKIFYIRKQKEPGKPKEVIYSNSKIIQVIKTYWELGHEHKFITEIVARRANECIVSITEPDYKNLNKNDIEDMYLLIMNGKVPDYAETGLLWSLSVFIRSSVIWERVHDFQLGIESYQQKVNLTAPTISFPGVEKHKIVLEGLRSYNNDVKYGYIQRDITNEEVEYLKLFEEDIEVRLKYRNQMRRWEMYVNGRPLGPRRERPE
ncbi:hypothetical protein Tco_0269067 [Tanacetum coccineum]